VALLFPTDVVPGISYSEGRERGGNDVQPIITRENSGFAGHDGAGQTGRAGQGKVYPIGENLIKSKFPSSFRKRNARQREEEARNISPRRL